MLAHVAKQLRARTASALRRSLRYRGMLVLVIWQVPIEPVIRPNGSIGFMIGGGSDEHAELSCDGDLISSEPVTYRVAAVQADRDITERLRVEGVAGYSHSDRDSHSGPFGTALFRADWNYFGVGAGIAASPGFDWYQSETVVWPSVYLRGGSADGLHVRADAYPPTALVSQQITRIGLGFNAVHRGEGSGFIGLAVLGHGEASTGVVAELTAPMNDRFALRIEGHYSSGHGHPVSGIAAGGRFLLGRPPALPAN